MTEAEALRRLSELAGERGFKEEARLAKLEERYIDPPDPGEDGGERPALLRVWVGVFSEGVQKVELAIDREGKLVRERSTA